MNRIKITLLVMCIIALTGCEWPAGKINTDQHLMNSIDDAILSTEYNGHKYIIYKGRYQGGITHDPDCPCHHKRDKDEND